jgi:PPOX class probable F420-dependent enzyme
MPDLLTPALIERLNSAYFVWFTSVRADGMPQPTPVWFIIENGTFLIYSVPTARKIRNLEHNHHAALNFSFDDQAHDFVVVLGTAQIDPHAPPVHQHQAYLAKYREGIGGIGMTPESMGARFSAAIRVTPIKIRDE